MNKRNWLVSAVTVALAVGVYSGEYAYLGDYEYTFGNIKSTYDRNMANFKKDGKNSYVEYALKNIEEALAMYSTPEYSKKPKTREFLLELGKLRKQCRDALGIVEMDARLTERLKLYETKQQDTNLVALIRKDLALPTIRNLEGFAHFQTKAEENIKFVENLTKPKDKPFADDSSQAKTPSLAKTTTETSTTMHNKLSEKLEYAKGYLKDANASGSGFDVVRRTLEPTLRDTYYQEKPGFARYKALAEQILTEANASEAEFAPVKKAMGKANAFTGNEPITNLQEMITQLKWYISRYPKEHGVRLDIERQLVELEKSLAERTKNEVASKDIETVYAEHKDAKPSSVNVKDVVINSEKYKDKIIRSRVQIANGPFPIFSPVGTMDAGIAFDCPKVMFDKIKRVHSAVGDYGIVKIKYWCNGTGNTAKFGVLLDIDK